MTLVYNKLVRDKIPKILESKGKEFSIEFYHDDKKYLEALRKKLVEETDEFAESNCSIEELADIEEVIHAILKFKGISYEEFEKLRLKKLKERGAFDNRIRLLSVEEENQC